MQAWRAIAAILVTGLFPGMVLLAGCTATDAPRPQPTAPVAPIARGELAVAPALAGTAAARALLRRADTEIASAAFDAAAATLERALTIAPGDAAVWHALGVLAYRRGDPEQALAAAAQARARSGGGRELNMLAWQLTGQVHADRGEDAAAAAAFKRAAGR